MKKAIALMTLLALMTVPMGCLGQNNRSPIKQVTAFIISVPCAPAWLSNDCYELVYMMLDTKPKEGDTHVTKKLHSLH